jgi:hypothetical protein
VKKVQMAEYQLQRDPTNEEMKDILFNSQSKLTEIFQDHVMRNRHLSSANWHMYGDTCSKSFFDFHRIGKAKVILRELGIENGTISSQADLSQYITDFYVRLYSSNIDEPDIVEAQEQCWASVPTRVTKETNALLTKSLTLKEILDAIHALPKGKAPRHDGIPMEFF